MPQVASVVPTVPAVPAPRAIPHHWLSFSVGAEAYGVDILRVQEIRSYEVPTKLVDAPPCVLGVIDLRGTIVPLLDLRRKFGSAVAGAGTPVVIVVSFRANVVGLVVDGVSDVVTLRDEHLRAMPELGEGVRHVMGLAHFEGRTLILVDIENLFELADADASRVH